MVSSEKETPLWVLRGSHKLIFMTEKQKTKKQFGMQMELITIPPWSVFIARGDFIRAGAAFDDWYAEYNVLVCYHQASPNLALS